jgi:external thioesterase TEII
MKIIAFTFAGGSRYSFQMFSKKISHFIVEEYPGRGLRVKEKLLTEIDMIIEDLLPKVIKEIETTKEYIIYGHSMGALIGFLICHRLQELEIKSPLKLVVSGRNDPSLKRDKKIADLPNIQFWEEVIKIGGIPDELKKHPELIDFYVPILKADFKAIEEYHYEKSEKLKVPIDVFYGKSEGISENEIEGWKNHSTEKVVLNSLEGNHFFIYNNESFFVNYFESLTTNIHIPIN